MLFKHINNFIYFFKADIIFNNAKRVNMFYGKVIGNIVATIKAKGLEGKKIQVVRPIDMVTGLGSEKFIVALDITGSGIGDYVGYEDGKEAAWAFEHEEVPTDATIVAIIDNVNITIKLSRKPLI